MSAMNQQKTLPPSLLLKWQRFYLSLPSVYVPGTDFDCSVSLVAIVVLTMVRYTALYTMVALGWPGPEHALYDITFEAAGSVPAIVHSVTLVPGLFAALISQPYLPALQMYDSPKWYRDAVTALMQLCIGYMLYDSVFSFIVTRWDSTLGKPDLGAADVMFLGHHFATAFYMTSSLVIGAGHISAMICMAIGEGTNPFHNAFLISERALLVSCGDGPFAQALHPILELVFSILYCVARIFIGPVAMLHISYHLMMGKQRKNVPLVLRLLWLTMIWGVVFGSIPWIQECWNTLERRVFGITRTPSDEL